MSRVRIKDEGDANKQANPLHAEMRVGESEQVGRAKRLRTETEKQRARDRYNHKYKADPEFRRKEALRARRVALTPEAVERQRARDRRRNQRPEQRRKNAERKRRWVNANRDKINEYRRAQYHARSGERIRKQVADSKRRINPLHGLQSSIWKLKRGDISLTEYLEQFDRAIARINEKDSEQGPSRE